MYREWMAVAIGGVSGALLRHLLSTLFQMIGQAWLPIATLVANVVGCFAIGYLGQWAFNQQQESHWMVTGIRVGLLGGFTTFSSFAFDLVRLWQAQRPEAAIGLGALHIILGLAAVVVGMSCVK